VRRGLSIRLRAEARVLRGLCVEAEAAGHGGHEVERVAHYCNVLEGWCLGERSGADLAGAVHAVSSTIDYGSFAQSTSVAGYLLHAARGLALRRIRWCAYPTHAPDDLRTLEVDHERSSQGAVLMALRPELSRQHALAIKVLETLYRAQAEELFALSRTPNRFAALDRAQAEELFALSRTPNRFAALDAMEGR